MSNILQYNILLKLYEESIYQQKAKMQRLITPHITNSRIFHHHPQTPEEVQEEYTQNEVVE